MRSFRRQKGFTPLVSTVLFCMGIGTLPKKPADAHTFGLALWAHRFSLAYDANGATGGDVPSSAVYASGSSVTVAANSGSLTRTGYTFAGWNTQADGNGSNFAAGSGSFTMGAANVTLYAKWTMNTYSVSYNGNGNTSGSVPAAANYTPNTTVSVAGNTGGLIRNGFTFAGWNTAANGSGTNYSAGQTFSMTANDIILYARWNAITPNYRLVLTGGSSVTVPEGYSSVKAWAIGGGGGGAGAYSDNRGGGGGGAGGVAFRTFTVTGGTTISYSIGGGGSAGYNSGNGGNGGQTSVTINGTTILATGGIGGCWNQGCTPWGGSFSGGDGGSNGGNGGTGCYNQDCGSGSGGAIGGASGSWGTSTAGYAGANSADVSGLFSVLSGAGYATTSGGSGGATGSSGTKNQNHGGNASGFGCGGGGAGYWGGNGGNGSFGGGGGGGNGENAARYGGSGGQGAVVLLLN